VACVIALDVGGSSVKSAIVESASHRVSGFRVDPLDSYGDADAILDALTGVVCGHAEQIASAMLAGAGIGFPGPFDYVEGICRMQGISPRAVDARGKFDAICSLDLRAALRARLGQPNLAIVFRNDAEAAIVGEAKYGAGCTRCRLIGVTLGTGLGSVFLVDGVPVTAGPGVPSHGWLYPMPVMGEQADDVFSTRGLMRRLQAAGVYSNVEQAASAARNGDLVMSVWRQFGCDLGRFLRPFALDFRAEAILVLGGIACALDLFGEPLARELPVPVLPSALGRQAALLGAADMLFLKRGHYHD
jgi:glucokinase